MTETTQRRYECASTRNSGTHMAEKESTRGVSVITDRIASRIDELGIRHVELAGAIRVSEGTVGRWYRGTHDPHASHIVPISQYLDVNPLWILGVVDDQGEAPTSKTIS